MKTGQGKRMKNSPMRKRYRILIVEDHPMMRHGLVQFLNQEKDFYVCAEVAGASEALRMIASHEPDLAIVDLTLADKSGLELTRDICIQFPKVLVLVHSMHDEMLFAERALRAGARGYLMKQESGEELIFAARHVLAGKTYLSPHLSAKSAFANLRHSGNVPCTPIASLSDRELEVFQLIGAGFNNQEIARRLHLSVKTVDAHREHIKRKLGLETATAMNLLAVRFAATG
jgi:DNA-binding NarL/FixJ family response regulator